MTDDADAFLAARHPAARALALRVRDVVRAADDGLAERVYHGWNGIGFRHEDGGYVCAIYPQPDGSVRLLFEHGARLPDPAGLLRGDGRQTRYVELRGDPLPVAALEQLVRDAIAERLFR